MKKIFTLLTTITLSYSIASAQLLVDDFNYSGALTSNGWAQTGLEAGDPIQTTTGLTYAGHPGSGIGNAAYLTGTLQDVNKGFTKQTANGTNIWLTAMVNVTESANITGNGVNFMHLGDRSDTDPTSFTNFAGRIYVKANATGVSFGTSQTSSSGYGTGVFQRNTTYVLVLKYTINTAGTDDLSLWVFPSGAVPQTEAGLGTPELNNPGAGLDEIDAIGLRQAANLPDIIVDGIRIANDYSQLALPLTLTSFRGILTQESINLKWTSENEINVRSFSIERSKNGTDFLPIGNVDAQNVTLGSYSFSDNAPFSGSNFYRLKINDKDGKSNYSAIVVINNRKSISTQIFPNPASDNINVSHSPAQAGAVMSILSIDGREVKKTVVEKGSIQTNISIGAMQKGSYTLVFKNGNESQSSQFIKQ